MRTYFYSNVVVKIRPFCSYHDHCTQKSETPLRAVEEDTAGGGNGCRSYGTKSFYLIRIIVCAIILQGRKTRQKGNHEGSGF